MFPQEFVSNITPVFLVNAAYDSWQVITFGMFLFDSTPVHVY